MEARRCKRGFTYLELVFVIAMIGILIAVALYKFAPLVQQAERVAVLRLEGELRGALMMEAAKRIASGRGDSLGELAHSNPMLLMMEYPATYLGEIAAPDPADIPVRFWYFDSVTRRLVYRAGSGFRQGARPAGLLEFEVQLAFADRDGDGLYRPSADEFVGLRLRRISGDAGSKSTGVPQDRGTPERISRRTDRRS